MTSYYIDPERCFEVPFRIPLPDKGTMAARLASIHLIMRNARERQSQFCSEHRRMLSSQPSRYRHKAKAMMDGGRLRRFVGDLARRYFDYLDFHQESPKKLSPLAIQIPSLCPSLSPPLLSYLFGPPKQDDFNSIIKSNLSWSQFAAPAPAGWREQFLYERRWERDVERRISNEYSDSERDAEYAALESQLRQLRACLRTEADTPPPVERKHTVPLPLTTPPLLSLNVPPGDEDARKAVADSGLSPVDGTRSAFLASEAQIDKAAVPRQLPTEHTRQRSLLFLRPSHRRPLLQIVIPGSDNQETWLGGSIYSSPLSGIGADVSSPSVLLDAHAVREYLDNVHGPHPLPPVPESPPLSYPSPPPPPSPLKLVTDKPAEQVSPTFRIHHGSWTNPPTPVPKSEAMTSLLPTGPGCRIYQPQPIYALKRSATAAFSGSPKRPRLMTRV